jgi:hypothetical protein
MHQSSLDSIFNVSSFPLQVSALITGEFYSRDQFPGFGRPFMFNAEILKR